MEVASDIYELVIGSWYCPARIYCIGHILGLQYEDVAYSSPLNISSLGEQYEGPPLFEPNISGNRIRTRNVNRHARTG